MKKLFVDNITDDMTLTGDDHLHVSVVLRARVGDELILCDGKFDCLFVITAIDKKSTALKLKSRTEITTEPKTKVDLYVALLKSDKLEWVCQKCTELGINKIYPFESRFATAKKESVRLDRLGKIVKEAAQQCGRGRVPVVSEPLSFDEMTERIGGYDNALFFYEKGGAPLSELSGSTALIVGSEGGFSDEEAQTLSASGVLTIGLGKRILRAETACVAATTLAMYKLGELQ